MAGARAVARHQVPRRASTGRDDRAGRRRRARDRRVPRHVPRRHPRQRAAALGTLVVLTVADVRLGVALGFFIAVSSVLPRSRAASSRAVGGSVASASTRTSSPISRSISPPRKTCARNGAGAHVLRRFHDVSADVYRADQRAEVIGGLLVRLTNLTFTIGTALLLAIGVGCNGPARSRSAHCSSCSSTRSSSAVRSSGSSTSSSNCKPRKPVWSRAEELFDRAQLARRGCDGRGTSAAGRTAAVRARGRRRSPTATKTVLHHVDLRLRAAARSGSSDARAAARARSPGCSCRLYDPHERHGPTSAASTCATVDAGDLRRRVAVVTQEVQLFRGSCATTSRCSARIRRRDERIVALLDELGLGGWFAARPPVSTPSSARTAAVCPPAKPSCSRSGGCSSPTPGLVILDEPSSRLDPEPSCSSRRPSTARRWADRGPRRASPVVARARSTRSRSSTTGASSSTASAPPRRRSRQPLRPPARGGARSTS